MLAGHHETMIYWAMIAVMAARKNYVANAAVSRPGRFTADPLLLTQPLTRQVLATAAPWTSSWLSPGYGQNFWNAA